MGPSLGIPLVVAGEHTYLCEDDMALPPKLGISEWVRYIGWIGHDELPCVYERALDLLLPSLYEACPSPILEAMAMGCPVLTGNRNGMKEMAGGAALLVDPDRVEYVASGIHRLSTDARLRECLAHAGRRRIRELSWRRCAEETLAVLESALPASAT